MTALPRSLKPWATQLAWLSHDLALALAPWIQRLATAIGPLAGTQGPASQEPDGFDGLATRGTYERLLVSEWLLADEVPDEFLRRAAQGELAFHRLARKRPAQQPQTAIAFDAGPAQLGAPRIAHLAALLVFAARAEARGAQLRFGTLQEGPSQARVGVDEAGILALLHARTWQPATQAQVTAWAQLREKDELWIIGGPDTPRAVGSSRAAVLTVDEAMQPGVRELHVSAQRPDRPAQRFVLPLPPAPDCVRLLRNPLRPPPPRPTPPRPAPSTEALSGLLFARTGDRLFAREASGGLVCITVPFDRARAVRPLRLPALHGEVPLAVGWLAGTGIVTLSAKRSLSGVTTHAVLRFLSKRGTPQRSSIFAPVAPDLLRWRVGEPLRSLVCLGGQHFAAVFEHGVLRWDEGQVSFESGPIVAAAEANRRLFVLRVDEQGRRTVSNLAAPTEAPTLLSGLGAVQAVPGVFASGAKPFFATADVALPTRWTIHSYFPTTVDVPPSHSVFGATSSRLFTHTSAGRRIEVLGPNARPSVSFPTTGAIVEAVTCPAHYRGAWLDDRGGVGVFDEAGLVIMGEPEADGRLRFARWKP